MREKILNVFYIVHDWTIHRNSEILFVKQFKIHGNQMISIWFDDKKVQYYKFENWSKSKNKEEWSRLLSFQFNHRE